MSIVACIDCGCYIDSDKHPECFDMSGRPYCFNCPPGYEGKDYTAQVEAMLNNPPENDDG